MLMVYHPAVLHPLIHEDQYYNTDLQNISRDFRRDLVLGTPGVTTRVLRLHNNTRKQNVYGKPLDFS